MSPGRCHRAAAPRAVDKPGMAIWVVFALMTGAAVLAVLWPLSRVPATAADGARRAAVLPRPDRRDRARRRARPSLADARPRRRRRRRRAACCAQPRQRRARRRHGRAGAAPPPRGLRHRALRGAAPRACALRRLRLAAASGAAARRRGCEQRQQQLDFATAVARIEAHLAAQSGGRTRLGGASRRSICAAGRFEDGGEGLRRRDPPARRDARRVSPPTARRSSSAKDGVVSAEARAAFEQALALDPAP